MNKKAIVPLVLGLGIGLLAVKFGVDAIRRAQASSQDKTTITVVVAKQDIHAFDAIEPNMIETVETVESPLIPAGERFSDPVSILGRVAGKTIPRGAPVLSTMLSAEGTTPGIRGRIPKGYRAVSVKIDEVNSASYQLRPGALVDVTVVMDVNTGDANRRARKETIAEVILQRIKVASVGYGTQSDTEKAIGKAKPAKSATLFVHKDDVPKLQLAQTRGKVALALRGDEDSDASAVASASDDELMGFKRKQGNDSSLLAKMFAMMTADKNKPAPAPGPTAVEQPRNVEKPTAGVLVFHHSSIKAEKDKIEQVVFKTAESTELLSIRLGAPTPASSSMRQNSDRFGGATDTN